MGTTDAGTRPRPRSPWVLLTPCAFALAGVLFAASAGTARGTDLRGDTRSDLGDVIHAQQRDLARQTQELDELRKDVDARGALEAQDDSRVAAVLEKSAPARAQAHLTPITGPSLTVTLDDAPRADPGTLPDDIGPDDLVVHQQDLQAVVNAMWAGGATGIQLMDQRVISTSAVRCVGNVLLLQGRTYPPPYRVTAVGDVMGMKDAVDASDAVAAYRAVADQVGLGWDVRTAAGTTLPAYEGSLALTYATVPDDNDS